MDEAKIILNEYVIAKGYPALDFTGWEVYPVIEDGKIKGGVMVRGDEIHLAMRENLKSIGSGRKHLREILGKMSSITTKVMKSNQLGLEFCKRLGFDVVSETPIMYVMRAEK